MMRDRRGFTLVEVIVAIAALAVASVFIMQMFMTSDRLSKHSDLERKALDEAKVIAELFKASTSYEAFLSAMHDSDDEIQAIMATGMRGYTYTKYYNQYGYVVAENEADARVELMVSLQEQSPGGDIYHLELCGALCQKTDWQRLFSFTVAKYYAEPVEVTP